MSIADSLAKAVVDEEESRKTGQKKELARMARAPFETLYQPSHEQIVGQLRGWSPPPDDQAYILLEKKFIERGDNNKDEIRYTLYTMLVGNRPDQIERLRYNLMVKGMRVLHYDRFPRYNDPIPKRAELAKMHYNRTIGKTMYDSLEEAIKNMVAGNFEDYKIRTEALIADQQAKIDDLTKKLAEKRSKDKGGEGDKEGK